MNKPRRRDYGDDDECKNSGGGYEGQGDCSESGYSFHEERTQDTQSLTTASLYSRSPEQKERDPRPIYPCPDQYDDHAHMRRASTSTALRDRFEKAVPTRPEPRRSSMYNSDVPFCSSSSMRSQGSFCSRSAPLRRTRIAREPSIYSADSGKLCNNSRRSLTVDSRRGGDKSNTQWQSRNRRTSKCSSVSTLPLIHIKIDSAQERVGDQRTQAAASLEPTMVNIAPGVQAPLRGARETVKAVAKDFYSNVSCFGCSLEVCCIADVSYVVCPVCKVVSPVEDPTFEGKEVHRHGLGLGFTYESLFKMQLEILQDRNRVHA